MNTDLDHNISPSSQQHAFRFCTMACDHVHACRVTRAPARGAYSSERLNEALTAVADLDLNLCHRNRAGKPNAAMLLHGLAMYVAMAH